VDYGLRGKVALVAAASRGLGRAVALGLANEGAKLVLCARGAEALNAARDAIAASTGVDVHAVVADLSRAEDVETVTSHALTRFGQVDILVTNAGGPPAGPFEKHSWDA
jgi:3-oxoacyl-[acyl-carrier protein] reductase